MAIKASLYITASVATMAMMATLTIRTILDADVRDLLGGWGCQLPHALGSQQQSPRTTNCCFVAGGCWRLLQPSSIKKRASHK